MKAKALIIAAALTAGLSGCANKTSTLEALNEILDPTETETADRNDVWYSKQDNIRNSVLHACFTHFNEEARIAGGQVLYDYYENPYSLFTALPDCINARKGEVITMTQQAVIQDEFEINDIQQQLQTNDNEIQIIRSAEVVAKRLESLNVDKNDENNSTLDLIYSKTKEGSKLEKDLIDANLVQ